MNAASNELPDILVVDDTPANLKLLCSLLVEQNWRARTSSSGELALRAAMARPPDLVLLDVQMPGIDGYETCRRLKATPSLAAVPVIFISAQADRGDKLEGFRAGGVDYIAKPFDSNEVVARVRTHLELQRLRSNLEAVVEKRTAELQRSYEALAAGEERLRMILDGTVDATWEWDADSDRIHVNEPWCSMLGLEPRREPMARDAWRAMIAEEDRPRFDRLFDAPDSGDRDRFRLELRVLLPQGAERWMLLRGRVARRRAEASAMRLVGTMIDIDERKRETLRAESGWRRLDGLLREVHRTTAADLRWLGGLLVAPATAANPEPEAVEAGLTPPPQQAAGRLRCLALVHEGMLGGAEPGRVDFGALATELVADIESRRNGETGTKPVLRLEPCSLGFVHASACALILNELMALAGNTAGSAAIEVDLRVEDDRVELRVGQQGSALAGFQSRSAFAPSWTLVRALTERLKGALGTDDEPAGVTFAFSPSGHAQAPTSAVALA